MPRAVSEFPQDILTNIDRVESHTAGKSEADLLRDAMLYDAVERCVERISEASRGIPDEIKAQHPAVPWHAFAAIGNRRRHGYFAVDASIIWQTASIDLPALRQTVLAIQTNLASGA